MPQDTSVLGAHIRDGGTSFGLWAPRATRVELALVDQDRNQTNHDMSRDGEGVWTVFIHGVGAEQRYGFRVHGPWDPAAGARFNPAKLLVDPYARAITGGVDYSGPILDHTTAFGLRSRYHRLIRGRATQCRGPDSPPPRPMDRPTPMSETVIYELHVKGFTRLHPLVPEHLRGTYAGLGLSGGDPTPDRPWCHRSRAAAGTPLHLRAILVGPRPLQLLGIQQLSATSRRMPRTARSSTLGQQVREFKEMVSALHEAGIEVILDVVYNHTGEGGHEGPTLSFRGIDHLGYYRLTDDQRNDYDVTGCGNSVDTSEPGVLRMVLDSLRYWVTEMGVDGFRFDLVSTLIRDERHHVDQDHPFKRAIREDPVLSQVKMIAEPWDMGPYGYQVGGFGLGWSEWNDRFRNHIRDFWRGNTHGVGELAQRLTGSPDIFDRGGRPATSSINFVTAHDGFTLRDLVTYNVKHNGANGESNRDGSDDNRSWNCGVEGESEDPGINSLRLRQAQNIMATLILAVGVPMIVAGDELGRTQQGNNNAYCQDSPISWVHWDTQEAWADQTELTRKLLQLRAERPVFRREHFRRGEFLLDAKGQPRGTEEHRVVRRQQCRDDRARVD